MHDEIKGIKIDKNPKTKEYGSEYSEKMCTTRIKEYKLIWTLK